MIVHTPQPPQALNFAGAVHYFAANYPIDGNFLYCNGAAVSRTTYAALFAVIGATFGNGDGSTTFNLPDLRAEYIRGWDDGKGIDVGRGHLTAQGFSTRLPVTPFTGTTPSAGGHTHTVTLNTTGAHRHNVGAGDTTGGGAGERSGGGETVPQTTGSAGDHNHTVTLNSNGNHTHTFVVTSGGDGETRPATIVALAYISY